MKTSTNPRLYFLIPSLHFPTTGSTLFFPYKKTYLPPSLTHIDYTRSMAYYSHYPSWSDDSRFRQSNNSRAIERLAETLSTVIVGSAAAALVWAAWRFGKQDESGKKGGGSNGGLTSASNGPSGPVSGGSAASRSLQGSPEPRKDDTSSDAAIARVLADDTSSTEAVVSHSPVDYASHYDQNDRGDQHSVRPSALGKVSPYGRSRPRHGGGDETDCSLWSPSAHSSGHFQPVQQEDDMAKIIHGVADVASALSNPLQQNGGSFNIATSNFGLRVTINPNLPQFNENDLSVQHQTYTPDTSKQAGRSRRSIFGRFTRSVRRTEGNGRSDAMRMVAHSQNLLDWRDDTSTVD